MDTTMKEELEEMEQEGVEAAKRQFNKGKEAVRKYASQAKDMATEYAKQAKVVTQDQIQQKPFMSMLIALGAGITLGILFASIVKKSDMTS